MLNNVGANQEKAETQKEKNERLQGEIGKFERRNRNMKKRINDSLLMYLGENAVENMD